MDFFKNEIQKHIINEENNKKIFSKFINTLPFWQESRIKFENDIKDKNEDTIKLKIEKYEQDFNYYDDDKNDNNENNIDDDDKNDNENKEDNENEKEDDDNNKNKKKKKNNFVKRKGFNKKKKNKIENKI
jgi:hypothetical protein